MMNERTPLADDLIWDVTKIAVECNLTTRKARYLIEKGQLPVTKLGPRKYVALRSELRKRFMTPTNVTTENPPRVEPKASQQPRPPKRRLRPRQ